MTYDTFEKLCKEAGVRPADVSKETGIARATFSMWKSGKSNLSRDKQELVAKYFHLSLYDIEADEEPTQEVKRRHIVLDKTDVNKDTANALQAALNAILLQEGRQLYYLDPETAKLAQELADNPDLKLLMDAARGARPEAIKANAELLMQMKRSEMNEDD